MPLAARRVFDDARRAFLDFSLDSQGHHWRHRWILNVVLLRAVGHVLDNVDGNSSKTLRTAIDEWWAELKNSKPEPAIFWQFIEQERNSIVKEYLSQGVQETKLRQVRIELATGKMDRSPVTEVTHTMYAGHYTGRNQHDLLREAISWWEEQLNSIEKAASSGAAEASQETQPK